MDILWNKRRQYTRLFEHVNRTSIKSTSKSTIISVLTAFTIILLFILTKKLHNLNISKARFELQSHFINSTSQQWRLDTATNYYADPNWDFSHPPTKRQFQFNVSQIEANPDGVYRNLTVINGQYPGPLIEINTGDTIELTVYNNHDEPTSFHFHGIFYENENYYDGVSRINQCSIPPHSSYTYTFTVDNQWGSYWYHSHYKTQYADGLFGPVIIHSKEEKKLIAKQKQNYDYDLVVLLNDYYHEKAETYIKDYLAPQNENTEPVPDNGLIQGVNTFDCGKYNEDSGKTCKSNEAGRYVFQFQQNKRYRLRLINAGVFSEIDFAIDQHPLQIIEIDGSNVESYTTNKVSLPVGQRISVILNTNQDAGQYWVHAKLNDNCYAYTNDRLDSDPKAILYYTDYSVSGVHSISSTLMPISSSYDLSNPLCREFNTTSLKPSINERIPQSDLFIRVDVAFLIKDYAISKGYINETTYEPLPKNTLYQELALLEESFDEITQSNGIQSQFISQKNFIYTLNEVKVIDVLINNLSDDAHPFHLHGHKFWVMKQSKGNWKDKDFDTLPSDNVVMRDTINVGAYEYAVIRFETRNPGVWLFHCSMLWHMEAGLMMQFNFLPSLYQKWDIPNNWVENCRISSD